MRAIYFLFIKTVFYEIILCYGDQGTKTNVPLPEFRRRVEEIIDDTTEPPVETTEDPGHNIVSFLIQNVKEIFKDTYDSEEELEETQTDSVNVLKRKEGFVDIADSFESISDNGLQMIADVTEKQVVPKGNTARARHDQYNPGALLRSTRKDFNFRVLEEEKNEKDYDYRPIEQEKLRRNFNLEQENDENNVESKDYFRKSTLLFRPIFAFATRSDQDEVTEIFFKSRPTSTYPTTFIYSGTEFGNNSETTSSDDFMKVPYKDSNESSDVGYLDVGINRAIHPLPFLVNNMFTVNSLINTGKGLMFIAGPEQKTTVSKTKTSTTKLTTKSTTYSPPTTIDRKVMLKEPERSCIRCNNAADDYCSSPRNKLISSTICKQDGDLCYSMHTPFGIVERGCFNINHNMSTYVCGCNLCNYVAFTDMPVIFASKQEWIQNIFDLSHLRSLTKSTLKNLSCLKCEVNGSIPGDVIYNTNCLEGHVGVIQSVKCREDEICGVKALKNIGYIWRGCVSAPLYNYYVTLCDSDLCNYDPIASVYDINDD